MTWAERQLDRVKSLNPTLVDVVIAAFFTLVGLATIYGQDIRDDNNALIDGFREPNALVLVTLLVVCGPIVFRRRHPLAALTVSSLGILVHILIGWPEGSTPISALFLTYTVATLCAAREAIIGLAVVSVVVIALGFNGSPGLDALGVLSVLAQFAAVWAIGLAVRNRRVATESRVREADERAEAERQSTARVLAEERLRIAQELHDVVAHSMSVIAVQAGVGAHVVGDRPDQARIALETISATSRGTLSEMRRLLGMLRDSDGQRSHAPAPGLADLAQLVDDVRASHVPATLHVVGTADGVPAGLELSAYRIVQEALTNVLKHAGTTTRVDVTVRHLPGSLAIEVRDDGRGPASATTVDGGPEGAGHGHVGMRERVELWGGELSLGPAPGGGFRVKALLPYGDDG